MSFSTLGIGASALTAAQRGVETAAHNISASSVEGYTRQRVQLVTAPPSPGTAGMRGSGMRGNGVNVVGIERLRSSVNDLAVRGEAGTAGATDARAAVLQRTQDILGPYGAGVPEDLTRLWGAFNALANDPSGQAARQATIDAATRVAGSLNDAAANLVQIREDTATQIGEQVSEVNSLASQVAVLNGHIAKALASGLAPNDMLDTRDLALDKLASLTGATSKVRENGMVDVLVGGQALVTGEETATVTTGTTPAPAGLSGDDPVVLLGGVPLTSGGSIGGSVKAAATDLRDVERRLDELAESIATTVNTQHAKGFDLEGAAGGAFFSGTRAADLAVDSALTPERIAASGRQVAGGVPMDGENATALRGLSNPNAAAYGGGPSLSNRVVGLATLLGSRAADAMRTADAADASLYGLQEQRSAANGVSIDEEMVDLVKFQHSYDAAARVISMADDMLDTIINRMGAGR